jgi:hypothetical protein
MNDDPEFKALLDRYKSMDADDFEALCLRAAQSPGSMTAAASLAMLEAATQRGTTFAEVVGRALEDREANRRLMKAMADEKQAKEAKSLKGQEQVMGWVGVLLSPVILIPSLDAQDEGGMLAGVAMLACSVWLIYSSRKKG